ncbi:MAG TPA: glycosyltransferase family 39 protein, partial [Bdellovibrionota bacterium]|nr:glycosyltransferase family 39 protein [Bdellovibrionota bacterium]
MSLFRRLSRFWEFFGDSDLAHVWTGFLAAVLIGVSLLWRFNYGSIHNYDDALYAQVTREVSRGHAWPLTFSGERYNAKPPLPFWIGGLFVRLFGDRESSYRILSALSFLFIVGMAYRVLSRRVSEWAGFFSVLILLGSPMLVWFSRRVMLDLPLAAFGVALLVLPTRLPLSWGLFWSLAICGWWTKEVAILPALASALITIAIYARPQLRKSSFGIGVLGFLISVFLLQFLRPAGRMWDPSFLHTVGQEALLIPAPRDIYWDVFVSDSVFVWLLPIAFVWAIVRPKTLSPLATSLGLATLIHSTALAATKTILPYYLLPVFVYGLLFLAAMVPNSKARSLRIAVALLALLQIGRAQAFKMDPDHPDLDPARATKELALLSAQKLAPSVPL